MFSLIITTPCTTSAQENNLTVPEFEHSLSKGDVQVLDVRTPAEYQSGHIKNALLADWNNFNEFRERIQMLDKTMPVYTYCLSGARSNAATEWLNKNGFKASNLSGGINAWKKSGKPVEITKAVKQITLPEYWSQVPKKGTVLVDFSAVWCPPCRKMTPLIDSLARAHGNRFTLLKIDGGTQTNLVNALDVEAFPTFIVYKEGKETWRKQGMVDAREFLSHLLAK
jgi:rhodanese-related sulfurtransferase